MFSNFKDTFIQKPQYTIAPPQAIIDSLSTNMPTGFYYVHDHDGYCRIENVDGISLSSGKVDIPMNDKDLFKNETIKNIDSLLKYCYNTQTPLKILPDEKGCFKINGEEIKATDFIKAPMRNIELGEMSIYMCAPKFPDPFDIKLNGDGYEMVISIQRVANHSISIQKFESISSTPIKLCYFVDIENNKFTFNISINIKGVSSIKDIVTANHIYNAFISGNGCIFDSHVDTTPSKNVTQISDDNVSFWDMVLEVERKLAVSFNASKGITYNEGNKLLEIYKSLIEKKPFKLQKKYESVSGNTAIDKKIEMNDIIGKETLFEFVETEEAEIMGVKLSYYGLIAIFGASVGNIENSLNTTGKFKIHLTTTQNKDMYSSTMYFLTEDELIKYRENHEHIKEFEQATPIDYLV